MRIPPAARPSSALANPTAAQRADGVTWPKSQLLLSGGTGYTVVQVLEGEDTAAVFFSRDGKCGVAMTLARVDLKAL